jgi:hypothetical protein
MSDYLYKRRSYCDASETTVCNMDEARDPGPDHPRTVVFPFPSLIEPQTNIFKQHDKAGPHATKVSVRAMKVIVSRIEYK